MATEASELPLRWSLPEPPLSKMLIFAWRAIIIVGAIVAVATRSWPALVMPCIFGFRYGLQPLGAGERILELTYAAAYGAGPLFSHSSLEWKDVRQVVMKEDEIRLYRHRYLSPLVLALPDEPSLRERILRTVQAKVQIWSLTHQGSSERISSDPASQ